jgi:hypothetical protein
MSTSEVKLFVPKGCFTAYVSGMTVVDEIFCPPLYSPMQKKVDKKFSVAWSSLPVFPFWLAADYDCIPDCLAECKNSEKKLSVLEKPQL